jgi:orotate phosphoribosyltransferase
MSEKNRLTENEILAEFEQAEAILKGHFILSSGLHSDTYLQCARIMMHPARGEKLCASLAEIVRISNIAIDVVVAPAMGGVVVGYEMGRQLSLPTMFCERVDGAFVLRRGFELHTGQRVLMVEDVVTTGKSSLEAVKCVEAHGAVVVAEASLINRSGGAHNLPFPLYSLLKLDVATYSPDNLPPHLIGTQAIKPGSRWLK